MTRTAEAALKKDDAGDPVPTRAAVLAVLDRAQSRDRRELWDRLRHEPAPEQAASPKAPSVVSAVAVGPARPATARASQPHAAPPPLPPVPPEPPPGSAAGEADLSAILRVIRRRAVMIAAITGTVIALALPLVMMTERTYRAELRLLLARPPTAELAASGAAALAPWDLTTELERLLSEPNVRDVIQRLQLDQREEFLPSRTELAKTPSSLVAEVIQRFHQALSIRRDGQTNVIQIGFTARDPVLAAEVPNALVRSYLTRRDTQLRDQASDAKAWMQDRITTERAKIADLETEAAEYRRSHGPLSPEFQMAAVYQISALEGRQFAIAQQRSDLVSRSARLDQAGSADSGGGAASGSALGALRRDLQIQTRDLARLLGTFGENHADVAALRETIAATESDLADEVAREKRALDADRAALDVEAAAVGGQLASVRDSLSRMGSAQVELTVLQQRTDARRLELAKLEDQLQGISTEGALPAAEAEILSPAAVPSGPTGRGRKFWMAVAAVGGFGLAVSVAVALDLLDRSLRSQDQLRGLAGIRPAGLVSRRRLRAGMRSVDDLASEEDRMFAESVSWILRAVRTNTTSAMPVVPEGLPLSVMVASALPGEGKSMISLALAASLARSGQRPLLVDCDLQRGTIRGAFEGAQADTSSAPGLADYLMGTATLAEVIQSDPATGIDWIGRGRGGAVANWSRMAELVAQAQGRFLILDCAPVLATRTTVELAAHVDHCLLVARWGRSRRRSLELAAARLQPVARNPVLVAINDVDPVQHARYGFADSDLFAPALNAYYLPRLPA